MTLRIPLLLAHIGAAFALLAAAAAGPAAAQGPNLAADNMSGGPPPGEIDWTDVPAKILRLHTANDCKGPGSDMLSVLKPERYELAKDTALYLVPCQLGAYNAVLRLFVAHSDGEPWIEPLFFAEYSRELGWTGTDRLINAAYDPRTGQLSMHAKGRGLGDCGGSAYYRWADYGFKLVQYRYWGECDGTHMPDDWPVIYQAPEPQ